METIIQNINAAITANLHEIAPNADLQAYELAESVAVRSDDDITFPAIILPNGECMSVDAETDKHDITLYHRLGTISYQEDAKNAFGDKKNYTMVADMSLLVFGKRSVLNQFQTEKIARQAIATIKECTLNQSNFNALQIFANEYAGVTYFMGSAYYLFKIDYRITNAYTICE